MLKAPFPFVLRVSPRRRGVVPDMPERGKMRWVGAEFMERGGAGCLMVVGVMLERETNGCKVRALESEG